MSLREKIAQLVRRALDDAQRQGTLPRSPLDEVGVERPQNPDHGDFACSLPLKLARPMHMSPLSIAETLASLVPANEAVASVWAAPPGFVNFALDPTWLAHQVDEVRRAGDNYGNSDIGKGQRVQVEFVSGNPTGPLQVGNARGAVIGSTLANILEAVGFEVEREYYINDAGSQIDRFHRSLYTRYLQAFGVDAQIPTDGYRGEYLVSLANDFKSQVGERFLNTPKEEAVKEIGALGLAKMLESIGADTELLRVSFDVWFRESTVYKEGQYECVMKTLGDKGYLSDRDGAVWFTSTAQGEEKDNVLVRSTGAPTYFASDVAYHYNKFVERGFDRAINVWGADHQGHVPRMKAVVAALGINPQRLEVIITQMVTLKRREVVVRLSKRSGDIVTLRELVEEVGPDACRFFFLSHSPESHMEFDLELAKEQSAENPVYYVQYAHARITGILALAQEWGINYLDGDLSLLTNEAELALIRKMLALPELIEMMARHLEPHHLPHYAQELATAFHWFYQQCRVVSSVPGEEEISKARLRLVEATKIVLARCLNLMSIEAPDRM